MGNTFFRKQIRENYIIKDEEADFYNMKGKGPFMVNSFGKKFLKPSLSPGYGYGGYGYPAHTLRAGNFYPTSDLRYMNRLQGRAAYSPLAQMQLQTYYNYYPNYTGRRY